MPLGPDEAEGTKRYVYVVDGGDSGVGIHTLERREIEVGIADATSYEVRKGLSERDVVALPGNVNLRDGMAVQVVSITASNAQTAGEKEG